MRETYVKAVLDLTDLGALEDASASASAGKEYDNLTLLKSEVGSVNYELNEHNCFVLDGTKEFMKDIVDDVSWVSANKSDSNANFAANTGLVITFSKVHTSLGITLGFGANIPAEVRVTWYQLDGTELSSVVFYPDSKDYLCKLQNDNYKKIKIEFLRSNVPGQYATLQFIRYGAKLEWSRSKIKTAKMLEEIDLTSATLSINTANVSIVDEDGEFDIKNETGAWKSVQKTQKMTITEFNGSKEVPAGTYYVDSQSYAGNIASFACIDAIGIIDSYTFYDGKIYNGETAGSIIDSIMAACNFTDYHVDEKVKDLPLYGWIGIQSCREALQMVCFATGAIADDSRTGIIRIYKPDRYVSNEVGVERKFDGGTTVQVDQYVSGVMIEFSRYSAAEKTSKIYDDELPAGVSRITFSKPYVPSSLTVSAGQIVKRATNYVEVKMAEEGMCTINGVKYESDEYSYQQNLDVIDAGETESVKEFSGCTLYNATLLPSIAESLLNYYSLRKTVSMRFIMDIEQSGQWVNIRDANKNRATSVVESLSVDLAGGYIATASCRGYSKVTSDFIYTSDPAEAYAGEEWIE